MRQSRLLIPDIFKFVALATILLGHSQWLLGWGWVGSTSFKFFFHSCVDLFLVVAGYLFLLKVRTIQKSNKEHERIRQLVLYYRHYGRRIYPIYFLAIIVNIVISNPGTDIWKYFFFLQGFSLPFHGWFLESWSLAVIAWFSILSLGLSLAISTLTRLSFEKVCLVAVSSIFFLSVILKVWLLTFFNVDYRMGVRILSLARLDCLATSFLVGWVCAFPRFASNAAKGSCFLVGAFFVAFALFLFRSTSLDNPVPVFGILMLPAFGYSLMMNSIVHSGGLLPAIKGLRSFLLGLLSWTATRSLYLYLCQIPILWIAWRWHLAIRAESPIVRFVIWAAYVSLVVLFSEVLFRFDKKFLGPRPLRKKVEAV